jgi:phenylalanyl-tRNA synthetase beta chain
MKIPLSWLKEYIDLDISIIEIASTLNNLGLEIEGVSIVGLPMPDEVKEFNITGLSWDKDKFVVAEILQVNPHPNADRLILCQLNDGTEELTILTGAPNLFEYKGKGLLPKPIKVAYAREGAKLYDGHQPGYVLTTLKRATIRGVDSFSMVCSEKELGISDEHEGVILLDDDAPVGMPLVDYMGDAVFTVSILPNMIRDACITGVARELAAALNKSLKKAKRQQAVKGENIEGKVSIKITDPDLNPRFVLGLVRGVKPQPSPYKVQMRLRLAGMRPINSIVDATNYVMLETCEPLHAFDYDVLRKRANGKSPTIITRPAKKGEKLTTLDGVDRELEDYTILVCDKAGALSLAGVMGGQESEVTDNTKNVLLEGAAWNFVNVRRTVDTQKLFSEASYRFARGLHPGLAEPAVKLGLDRIAAWSGGEIAAGLVDEYPLPYKDPQVIFTEVDVKHALGIEIPIEKIQTVLTSLGFKVRISGEKITAKAPDHRTDIHSGVEGKADIMEEIARMVSYDSIPATRLEELMPPIHPDPRLDAEEHLRDALITLGLQEIITYRMTEPSHETRLTLPGSNEAKPEYVELINPLSPERSVMRRNLLASVLDIAEKNVRTQDRLALFEIAPVFLPEKGSLLPREPLQLAIVLTGSRLITGWEKMENATMDFFDLKGIVESILDVLHVGKTSYAPFEGILFHPGKCAQVKVGEQVIGTFGELHPLVKERYELGTSPVIAAEIDLEALLPLVPDRYETSSVPGFPPVIEDIAILVDETVTHEQVETLIRQIGGKALANVRLFDIFRSEQLGMGKKSLAFNLTYQAWDHTMDDKEAAQIRQRIIKRLEQVLGAKLRS